MTKRIFVLAAAALCAVLAARAEARLLVVDDDNVDCFNAPYRTINEAIVASVPGDEIDVCPGVYAEQVVLPHKLLLVGIQFGSRRAVIRPVALPITRPSLLSTNPVAAGIIVDTAEAHIDNVDLDMTTNGVLGCTPVLVGIYFRNASGSIDRTGVSGVRVASRPDCESGVGIYVESGQIPFFGLPIFGKAVVFLEDDLIGDYQKAGIAANGINTVIRGRGVKALGDGPRPGPVQIGIQLGFGATGRIQDSGAEDQVSTEPGKLASGFLLFSVTRSTLRRNTVKSAQAGVFIMGGRNRMKRTAIGGSKSDGLVLLGRGNRGANNSIGQSSVDGVFIDGEGNQVRGGDIAEAPVGVWTRAGSGNRVQGVTFTHVPVPMQNGGTRTIDPLSTSPFVTTCDTQVACDDGNLCTTDACDLVTGICSHVTLPNGTACADATVCNGAETCVSGVCAPGTPLVCNDGNPCTIDSCDAIAGCQAPNAPDGTSCADNTVCNGIRTCNAAGVCQGTPLTCDDGNPCTVDSCDPIMGCQAPNAPDGTPCPDATVCNGDETCLTGVCSPGTPLNCDDLNECTADSCDAVGGCSNVALPDGTICSIGLCTGGVCL